MEINKNHLLFKLYKFGSWFSQGKGRGNKINFWTFIRRITLGSMYVAYLTVLKLIGVGILLILIEIPAAAFTLLSNFVTVPLGIGISEVHPDGKFLRIPFLVTTVAGEMNLAWFLVPLWVLVVNIWFMAFGHVENLVSVIVWLLSIVLLICYIHAINLAKKGELAVEFVEPTEETKQSLV